MKRCGGGGGGGGWPLHILPKLHDWQVAQLVYFSYNTAYSTTTTNSNPQSKKGDHQLILHKRPLKSHYMIHNTQYQ